MVASFTDAKEISYPAKEWQGEKRCYLIIPNEKFRTEHLPEEVPGFVETNALGLAPEVMAVVIGAWKALVVTEIDVTGEVFGVKVIVLIFCVLVF